MPNAQVRSTARGTRLRAWPTPRVWRQSKNVTSIAQRIAYLATRSATVAVRSVVTNASMGAFGSPRSRTQTMRTGRGPKAPYHRESVTRGLDGFDAPVAGDGHRPPDQVGGGLGGFTQLGAFEAGPAPLAGAGRSPAVESGVAGQPGGPGDLLGQAGDLLAVVGGVGHHMDAPGG